MKEKLNKWKETAKKYGCVFDNIDFEVDKEKGVKAVALNKEKPFYLKVVFPVLTYADEIVIEDNKHFVKTNSERPKELENIINEYLDFIFSKERIEFLKNLITNILSLPKEIKQKLKRLGLFNLLDENLEKESIKRKLLQARTLGREDKKIFMPFVDFLNHHYIYGLPYEGENKEVIVKGAPAPDGEIYAVYNNGDVFHFLNTYFFVPEPFIAYSIFVGLNPGLKVNVGRNYTKGKLVCNNQLRIPEIDIKFKEVDFPYVWIGSERMPRRPFWSFQKVWEEQLGRKDTVKIFTSIKSANMEFLIDLFNDLDKLQENYGVRLLKKAILSQLKLIASTFEDTTEKLC